MTAATLDERVAEQLGRLNPQERTAAEGRLGRILTRRKALHLYRTPTELARGLSGDGLVITPMLRMLDAVLVSADAGFRTRWVINTPPQESKTTTINQWGALWLLLRDPGRRIVVASYEQGIAARSGLAVRQLIEAKGGGYLGAKPDPDRDDKLGLVLDPMRSQQTAWALAGEEGFGSQGSMLSVGIGSALTGRAANVLIIDDPLKDAKQADSPVYRERAKDWYRAVATTRLSGQTIVIVIQTRWHEDDLSGWLIRDDDQRASPRWSRLIIPAQAEQADPLGRAPGQWLESVQRRTPDEWEQRKEEVGERVWFALYQQRPSPPGGGVFQRAWFARWRTRPGVDMQHVVTWVDPADNSGSGDEAGVITGGLGSDGVIYVLEDASGHMTVGRWLRVAFLQALKWGGSRVRYERSLSQLRERGERAWKDLRRQARVLAAFQRAAVRAEGRDPDDEPWPPDVPPEVLREAVEHLSREDDTEVEKRGTEAELRELWPYAAKVMELPSTGIPLSGEKAEGTKTHRAIMAAPLFQGGSMRLAGHFAELEHQMATWQEHQDSPDRMDAVVHLGNDLAKHVGTVTVKGAGETGLSVPTRLHRQPGSGQRRPARPPRSGRWDPTAGSIPRSTR